MLILPACTTRPCSRRHASILDFHDLELLHVCAFLDLSALRALKAVNRRLLPFARETIGQVAWRARQTELQFDAVLDGASAATAAGAVAPLLRTVAAGTDLEQFPKLEHIKLLITPAEGDPSASEPVHVTRTLSIHSLLFGQEIKLPALSIEQTRLIAPLLAMNTALMCIDSPQLDDGEHNYQLLRGAWTNGVGEHDERLTLEELVLTSTEAVIIGQLLKVNTTIVSPPWLLPSAIVMLTL